MKNSTIGIKNKVVSGKRKLSELIGLFFIVVGYYMFGPFLHKETWEQVRYRIKSIKNKFQENKKHTGILGRF